MKKRLTKFLVVGIYSDGQRWAQAFMAENVAHAEEQAMDSVEDEAELIIAGVIRGHCMMVMA